MGAIDLCFGCRINYSSTKLFITFLILGSEIRRLSSRGMVGIKRRYSTKAKILSSKSKFNNYVKDSDVFSQNDQRFDCSVQERISHSTIQQQILSWLLGSHWHHWALSLIQDRFTLYCKVQSWGKKDTRTFTIPSKFNLEINRWSTCCLVKGRQELQ